MKKLIVFFLTAAMLVTSVFAFASCGNKTAGNYTDDMKIAHTVDLNSENGADAVERDGDHTDSPYFKSQDYYNMTSTETLTIISHFKTYQQTSEWSCGVCSALMVMDYYGKLGNYNEQILATYRNTEKNYNVAGGTSLRQAMNIFDNVGGFSYTSTYNYSQYFDESGAISDDGVYSVINADMIVNNLKKNIPVMVCWIDWGGHWQVIIGYDTMGTETTQDDVIIVADPYDTTDQNQDGYGVYGWERFYYNWSMYDFFAGKFPERDKLFLAAKPL